MKRKNISISKRDHVLILVLILFSLNNIITSAQSFEETIEWIDNKIFRTEPTYKEREDDFIYRRLLFENDSLIIEHKAYRDVPSEGRKLVTDWSVILDPKDINFNNIKLSYLNKKGWIKFSSNNEKSCFINKELRGDEYVQYGVSSFQIGFSEDSLIEYPQILERMRKAWINLIIKAGGKGEIF